jgi:hypothetical protein
MSRSILNWCRDIYILQLTMKNNYSASFIKSFACNDMETYFGYIKCAQDALLIFKACHLGVLPRVRRRLSDRERFTIRSGSVFVWYEREAGMRRWTDGRSWSPSRVSGSFLTYKELNCKQKSRLTQTDQTVYKENGLIKQSFSITTQSSEKIHIISYYTEADVTDRKLICPTDDSTLAKSIKLPNHNQHQRQLYREEYPNVEPTLQAPLSQLQWQSPLPTTIMRYNDEENSTGCDMSVATTPSLINSPDCNSVSTTSQEEQRELPAIYALNPISKTDAECEPNNIDIGDKIQLPPIALIEDKPLVGGKHLLSAHFHRRSQEDERQVKAVSEHLQLFF